MALRAVWLLVALLGGALGCRRFDVCGTADQPCERAAGAAASGAGAPGDGSGVGNDDCSATHANCDRSTLNGCETDLQSSPRHCGACDQECPGVCTLGSCVPFEVRVPDIYDQMANVLVTGSFAFFVARPDSPSGGASLGRYDLTSGEVTWVVDGGFSDVVALAATATRLYLVGDRSLYSIAFRGDELRDEGLVSVQAVSTAGTTVAVIADGEAYVRSDDEGPFELIPGEGYVDAVVATLSSVFIAREAPESTFSLEEFSATYDTHELITTGSGYVRALHVVRDINSAYVATEEEYGSETWVLRSIDWSGTGEPLLEFPSESHWVITSEPSPLSARAWVGTYAEGSRRGLRLVTLLEQSFSVEWPTVGEVETLSATETELWFVDPLRHALVSIDLEAMIEKAVAVPLTD